MENQDNAEWMLLESKFKALQKNIQRRNQRKSQASELLCIVSDLQVLASTKANKEYSAGDRTHRPKHSRRGSSTVTKEEDFLDESSSTSSTASLSSIESPVSVKNGIRSFPRLVSEVPKHRSTGKVVSFSRRHVTEVRTRPWTPKEDISSLYYSSDDLVRFRKENRVRRKPLSDLAIEPIKSTKDDDSRFAAILSPTERRKKVVKGVKLCVSNAACKDPSIEVSMTLPDAILQC